MRRPRKIPAGSPRFGWSTAEVSPSSKSRLRPKAVPAKFYWFRWEALITWISGFLLLGLLYYSGGLLLDDSVSNIGMGTGVAIGLGTLIVGFTVYEGI